jgi:hypothetical protein
VDTHSRGRLALFSPHSRALTVLHDDLERHALSQETAFVGTAGSVVERENAGSFRFYARSYYDADGKKREEYVAGPVDGLEAQAAARALRERIREVKALVPSLRMLRREGYNVVDPRTYGTIASLSNHGVFSAGGFLIGSHAYGIMLNKLGVRGAAYSTEDVDIARAAALAFEQPPEQGLLGMLLGSGLEFVEVPRLASRSPSTSFKERGRSHFHVDLLVPSPGETFPVVSVPELKAHASGLPYLDYLLAESQPAMLMAREGCCAVRVPVPERFAVHKLVVSRLRSDRSSKPLRDVHQAAVLAAALAETTSGAIEAAVADLPKRARRHLVAGRESARQHLEGRYDRAWAELGAG